RGVPMLPFAYVFGRTLFAVSFFGANVYPENVTVGLERPDIAEWTTGKFVVWTEEDADRDARLRLLVELAPGESPSEERAGTIAESVTVALRRLNSEFAN